jgi:P4 family phage/plasmid primase-like protien
VDVDVKDPTKLAEAEAKLAEITRGQLFPEVRSGGGKGSRHLYCITPEPFKMVTVARQPGWEICIYSEGRQMVLPPSIHPVTGKAYAWTVGVDGAVPTLDVEPWRASSGGDAKAAISVDDGFEPVDVDVVTSELPDATVELILSGGGCVDRSAALYGVATAMVKARFTDAEILSVLTDRSTFLGKCAYDHAQTTSRARAAAWVLRYTLTNARADVSAATLFESVVDVSDDADLEALGSLTVPRREDGYYTRGEKGKLTPNFDALLAAYAAEHPFRTIADMKEVFTFNGTHYVGVTPIELKSFAEDSFRPKPTDSIRTEFLSKVFANCVTRREFFTRTTEGKVNFRNGVLDVSSGAERLVSHSPEFGFRGVLPYDYDAKAECPVFAEWLNGVMRGDADLVAILQEYMGYVVRGGDYKYHKALWLGGVGRNGKSTFVDVLKALIGVGNFACISIKALVNDRFASAMLDGMVANFSEETSPQELADSGPFKNLTGDGELQAQKKYGDPYFFRNRAKLIMTYNRIPDLADLSRGMLSRPLIVPFEKIIAEKAQDQGIKRKLFRELPGIFNFALRGWHRLEDQGQFTESSRSALALKRVEQESCNVYQWVEQYVGGVEGWHEGVAEEVGNFTPGELYTRYCKRERRAYRAPEFFRRLNKHPLIESRRKKVNGTRIYRGLVLEF